MGRNDAATQGNHPMANNHFPYTDLLEPFQTACDAWQSELTRVFGKNAGQARYEPRGQGDAGSALRQAYEAFAAARAAWHRSAY